MPCRDRERRQFSAILGPTYERTAPVSIRAWYTIVPICMSVYGRVSTIGWDICVSGDVDRLSVAGVNISRWLAVTVSVGVFGYTTGRLTGLLRLDFIDAGVVRRVLNGKGSMFGGLNVAAADVLGTGLLPALGGPGIPLPL